ncbi:MAG: 4Fe-4S binding protein [Thaumarchaeota archaeon]|nr:4Fe-4S binding protein [Nitrososphaerota archaeon]MDG6907018.1 4Fe-4S binding protein [Nitrososphaerota archaeon]
MTKEERRRRETIGGALGEMFRTAFQRPITKEYPFGEPQVSERFRGKLDIDPVKCTGCGVCEVVCPAEVITMVHVGKRKVGEREIETKRPTFDLYTCISCGQCVDDCRFGALRLTHEFELATFDKNSLVMDKALKSVS